MSSPRKNWWLRPWDVSRQTRQGIHYLKPTWKIMILNTKIKIIQSGNLQPLNWELIFIKHVCYNSYQYFAFFYQVLLKDFILISCLALNSTEKLVCQKFASAEKRKITLKTPFLTQFNIPLSTGKQEVIDARIFFFMVSYTNLDISRTWCKNLYGKFKQRVFPGGKANKRGNRAKSLFLFSVVRSTLVTQPMLQRRPNPTELRLMDLISKFYADSKNVSKKFRHCRSTVMRSDNGGTFRLHFWNLHKIWI